MCIYKTYTSEFYDLKKTQKKIKQITSERVWMTYHKIPFYLEVLMLVKM